jgi:two-component system sensor histidine kinase HydH
VVREAVRLEQLTADLLSFVRSEQVDRRDVDPAGVLEAAVDEVGAERIAIDATSAPGRWPLDARLMQRVLANLLRNALQASPDGTAEATLSAENGQLIFRVRDHGEGIASTERERIFEPFFTTRLRGTGLGLAVASRIVALHRGTITQTNHPDGGALFSVVIPRS